MHSLQTDMQTDLGELRREVETMVGMASAWYKMYGKLNDKFKEVGDLYNWSKVVEEDLVRVLEKRRQKSADAKTGGA